MRIVLASASPRRRELMDLAEFNYEIMPSKIEEVWDEKLSARENSINLGYQKAKEVFDNTQGDRAIVGSDTMVVVDGKALGKPKNREEAIKMLRLIQGRKHSVFTSLSVIIENRGEVKEYKETFESFVYIKKMEDSEILNYIDTYNVFDKAGAYAIQSKFSVYVQKIDGDYNAIIGLPVSRLYDIFKENEIW